MSGSRQLNIFFVTKLHVYHTDVMIITWYSGKEMTSLKYIAAGQPLFFDPSIFFLCAACLYVWSSHASYQNKTTLYTKCSPVVFTFTHQLDMFVT